MHPRSVIKYPKKKSTYSYRDNKYFLKLAKQEIEKQKLTMAAWAPFFVDKKQTKKIEKNFPKKIYVEYSPAYFYMINWRFQTRAQQLFGLILLSQIFLPVISYATHHTFIHDIPVEDFISSEFKCIEKTIGISDGKVCEKNGITYFMKDMDVSDSTKGSLEAYNRQFVKENIGIKAPGTKFYYEKDSKRYSIASEKLDGFVPAVDFVPSFFPKPTYPQFDLMDFLTSLFRKSDHQRLSLLSIAQRDVAKLAVAMTFIDDLNTQNWGVDNNGIVLVDVDSNMENFPFLLNYYQLAGDLVAELKEIGFSLSLANIMQMQDIYRKMLTKPLPKFHAICQLSHTKYITLLGSYIKACENTIANLKLKYPKLGLHEFTDSVMNELEISFKKLKHDKTAHIRSRGEIGESRLCL